MPEQTNVSSFLREHAAAFPDKPALIVPDGQRWTSITYRELNRQVDQYARGFDEQGLRRGQRVMFLVKPGIDFYASLFALFRMGAIPVLMDPGMGISKVLECIEGVRPDALLALPMVHVIRLIKRRPFANCRVLITAGSRLFWGGVTLRSCLHSDDSPYESASDASANDEAMIAFTSGSTGPAKGVSFNHGMFVHQGALLAGMYDLTPDDIQVECFAAFVIYDLAVGMTVVLPDINMSKPAKADPALVVRAIEAHKATGAFASPVIWANVTRWCQKNDVQLPTLKRVLTAGAPIPHDMHVRFKLALNEGVELFTPYGATESLPVANIGSAEVLAETWSRTARGHGTCVGRPFPNIQVEIVRITDEPMPQWSDELRVAEGEVGEFVIDGPTVSPEYKDRPDANLKAKIQRDGRVMHRIGDIGYRDEQGRLWFCGRKAHALWTASGMVPAVPVEGVFNEHPRVLRTALVGVGPRGAHIPVLCVQLEEGAIWSASIEDELAALAEGTKWQGVVVRFLHNDAFPTDPRHNSKIKREELALWAAQEAGDLVPGASE